MKLHRYEYVSPGTVARLNQLLVRGWHPVREIKSLEAHANNGDGNGTLVLLGKDSDFPQFPGDSLGGISVDFVREVALFDGFTMEELRTLLTQCEVLGFEPNQVIFADGDPPDAICVILDGDVKLVMPQLPINETLIAELGPGDIFGESTFFSPAPHNITAQCADSEVTLLSIGRVAYDELHQANHPAAMKLAYNAARLLAARLQSTDRWMWDLLREDQNAQVAASWRRFRQRVHTSTEHAGGFFGV